MDGYTLLIAVTNTVTLLAGGLVALLAYRAFRRTDTLALRAVAVGFGFMSSERPSAGCYTLVRPKWSSVLRSKVCLRPSDCCSSSIRSTRVPHRHRCLRFPA